MRVVGALDPTLHAHRFSHRSSRSLSAKGVKIAPAIGLKDLLEIQPVIAAPLHRFRLVGQPFRLPAIKLFLVDKQIDDIAAQRGVSRTEAARTLLAEKQPSLEFVSPAQLGGTVAFLCSSAADQITGTAISVDGGWTAQ